jgi:hypothetical protein
MEIGYGNLLVCQASGLWWIRQNAAWVDLGTTPPDGATIYGGNPGILTTSEGTWTFGAQASDGTDWYIQLNGSSTGWAVKMQITNGNLYALQSAGLWWVRQNGAWVDTGTTAPVEGAPPPPPPPPSGAVPIAIALSPASATTPDNAPAGTVLTTATVTMSDGSQFAGTLTSSDTTGFFAISGLNLVTARALTSADDGLHSTVITASQNNQSVSMEVSI